MTAQRGGVIRSVGVILPAGHDGLGNAVLDTLRRLGYDAVPLSCVELRRPVDALLVCGPFYSLSPVLASLAGLEPQTVPGVIVWLTEQTPSPALPAPLVRLAARGISACNRVAQSGGNLRASLLAVGLRWGSARVRLAGDLRWLYQRGYLRLLAVQTPSHQRFFRKQMGVPAVVVPYGSCATFGRPLGLARDIDVLFLGSLRDRRRSRLVDGLAHQLEAQGVGLVVKDGSPSRGYVFGEERTTLLNRTKIMLNIMRQPWDDVVFRMLLAAPNGALVVSEPVVDRSPFMPGEHFVVSPLEQMAETVHHYLHSDAEREHIASAARALVSSELTMTLMARLLMDNVERGPL